MSWNPSDQETYVFRRRGGKVHRVVLLFPGGMKHPSEIVINGVSYVYDEEMTEQTRMHVRVSNRKKGLAD